MKKTTKILSVLLALIMAFSCVPMTAFASVGDTSSLDKYLDNDNLAAVVGTLLTDLGARKEEIVPTVLNLVFMLDQLKDKADEMKVDVATADAEALAGVLIAYGDEYLAETDLNSKLGGWRSAISSIFGSGFKLNLNSVDGFIETLAKAIDILNKEGKSFSGDASKLSSAALYSGRGQSNRKVIIRKNGASNLDIVNALLGFLADPSNISVIKIVIKGDLKLGLAGTLLKNSFDVDELNKSMKNLKADIKKMLYDNLVATWVEVDNGDGTTSKQIKTAYEKSQYKDYTADELLASALVKLMTNKDVDKATAKKVAGMKLSQLIGEYGDYLIASFALEPLNNDLKTMLNDLVKNNKDLAVLKNILNLDYEFAVSDFNFKSLAETGIFEGLNNLVCGIIEKLVKPSVAKELALKKGGNENITANLTSFCSYVLKTLSSYNGGKLKITIDGKSYSYDFSAFTADKLAGMDLEAMVVEVANLLVPSILGVKVPEDADSLEKLLLYVAYYAIDHYMVQPKDCAFKTNYKKLVFNADNTIKDLDYTAWVDTMGTMAMDVAIYWLNRSTDINLSQAKVDKYKAAGWTWEDFFEEIVDWALGYIAGFPAVADELSIKRGVADGNGPWYKLNVVINELFALNFVNDCGDETFVVDTYNLMLGKVVPSLLDCDLAAFANVLSKNKDKESIFNKSVITGVLDMVDNLLFSLFEHSCAGTATFTKAATATHDGYKGTYCKANGHYITVTTTPATGAKDPAHSPEKPDYIPGDVDDDGKVSPADARLALRASAGLDELKGNAFLAADVNGDKTITPAEARAILRVAAGLDLTFVV